MRFLLNCYAVIKTGPALPECHGGLFSEFHGRTCQSSMDRSITAEKAIDFMS